MLKALVQALDARPDAITLLKQDHRTVEALFDDYKSAANAGARWRIAQKICAELDVHAKVEETVFYPAARKSAPKAKDEINEGIVEHMALKRLIKEIQRMKANDELFHAKVTVLIEYTLHHVREEERDMFPMIADSGLDLVALEPKLAAAKQKFSEAAGIAPKPAAVLGKRSSKSPRRRAASGKRARSGAAANA